MKAQDIYEQLLKSDESTQHLILARLFSAVFGRKMRTNEWGHMRKLIRLYGGDTVYWALLNSSNIDASGSPLVYVSKVCIGMLKERAQEGKQSSVLKQDTLALLQELRDNVVD